MSLPWILYSEMHAYNLLRRIIFWFIWLLKRKQIQLSSSSTFYRHHIKHIQSMKQRLWVCQIRFNAMRDSYPRVLENISNGHKICKPKCSLGTLWPSSVTIIGQIEFFMYFTHLRLSKSFMTKILALCLI